MINRSLAILFVFLIVSTTPSLTFAEQEAGHPAIVAAEQFVETLDNLDFSAAWNQTGIVNQSYIDHPEWYKKLLAVRPHLGHVIKRSIKKLSQYESWVGLPDRDYRRVSFATTFLNKANSLETVILIEEQGAWYVSSYHLR